ncbi:MAG: 50S ribosomal protein L6 [Candidatus Improbicoccus pseudotrichonymphae]|uniref:Large ribosomal subunit protein uL6 n=1 Tax=Candidatus Improbicoccus pseudotrichonymphae TaxID=3033792 RepID=A0AA48HUI5_9FIRM|nr:MAG: 50S ribosomal protein L6 [Candidatus Improbicoccus pseudotrichonymphae]
MSRIGMKPISIPEGVKVGLSDFVLRIEGPKGELSQNIHENIKVEIKPNEIIVSRPDETKFNKSLHGLMRSLIFNMVKGVTEGFERVLEINGVGYKAQKQGNKLLMNLGYSHQVFVEEQDDIKLDVSGNKVKVSGIDKQKVGQFAANIRSKRPPEPYQGKGIKYLEEIIKRKEGKAGKSAKK